MIIEGDAAKAVMAALPKGVRARMSMSVLKAPADIRHYVQGALGVADDLDVVGGELKRDGAREDDVAAALKRFDESFDGSGEAAKAIDDTLKDLLSREERMHAMLGAFEAAGKRLDVSLVDADEG